MKTLALSNGDLVVAPTGHQTVSGVPKIHQDLQLALGEEFGGDRFHPGWGSLLIRYLGQPITPDTELLVESEINRVINNYIAVLRAEVLQDTLAQQRSRFATSDVVQQVVSIEAQVDLDIIRIKVVLRTQSNEDVVVVRQVAA